MAAKKIKTALDWLGSWRKAPEKGAELTTGNASSALWAMNIRKVGVDGLNANLGTLPVDIKDAVLADIEKEKDGGDVLVGWTISDKTVDSYKDTINPDGWDLGNFKKNPVVLWAHDQRSPPIGRDVGVHILAGTALKGITRFNPPGMSIDGFVDGDTVGRMVLAKILNATSVGFEAIEWVFTEERAGMWGPAVDFLKQMLREYTVCPVPANPNCLADRTAFEGIDMRSYTSWCERVLDTTGGSLRVPRAAVEAARRAVVGAAPVVVHGFSVTAIEKDGKSFIQMLQEKGQAQKDAAKDVSAAVDDGAEVDEVEADMEPMTCPVCLYEGTAGEFAAGGTPEPAEKAHQAQHASTLASGFAASQHDAASHQRAVAEFTARETARQITERTGRLP